MTSRLTFIYNIRNGELACSWSPDALLAKSPVCVHLFLAGHTLEAAWKRVAGDEPSGESEECDAVCSI